MNRHSALLFIWLFVSGVLSLQTRSYSRNEKAISSPLHASSVVDPSSSSFRDRMLRQMNTRSRRTKPRTKKNALVKEVRTLEEYKRAIVDEANGSLVVVWFYAPWCRLCRSVSPGFASLAKHHPETKFFKVPVLEDNANLHQGLDVPSVPYVHLYHPTAGLVEERKLARKNLPGLHKMLQDYVEESCSLVRTGEWSSESPYVPAPKAR